MAGPFVDDFNRSNANLDSSLSASGGWSWTADGLVVGAVSIVSNRLVCNTTDGLGSMYKTPSLGSADHYVEMTVADITELTGSAFCCRVTDRSNYIGIRCGRDTGNGQIEVINKIAGVTSLLYQSAAGAAANGDVLRLEVAGTGFTVYKNGVSVTTGSVGSVPSTQVCGIVGRATINTTSFGDQFNAVMSPPATQNITGTLFSNANSFQTSQRTSPWVFVATGAATIVASGDMLMVEPVGSADGDLQIAFIDYRSTVPFVAPAGWTIIQQVSAGNTTVAGAGSIASGLIAWRKRSGAGSLTFTRTGGDLGFGRMASYRTTLPPGVDPVYRVTASIANTLAAASLTVSNTGLTTTDPSELVVHMFAMATSTAASAFLSSGGASSVTASNETQLPQDNDWSERTDSGSTTGADGGMAYGDMVKYAAGSTGTIQATSAFSARHVSIAASFTISRYILGERFDNTQTFYTAVITQPAAGTQNITGALFSNANTFFTSVVSTSAAIAGALFTDADTFYGATVSATYSISGSLFSNANTFFTSVVSGSYPITGSLFSNATTFYTAVITQPAAGSQAITGALFSNSQTFFTATVSPGAVAITGALFSDADTFFTAVVSGTYPVTGSLYQDPDTFFTATVSRGTWTISGSLYQNPNTFFTATIVVAGGITGSLYANDNTFFSATITQGAGTGGTSNNDGAEGMVRTGWHYLRVGIKRKVQAKVEKVVERPGPLRKKRKKIARIIAEDVGGEAGLYPGQEEQIYRMVLGELDGEPLTVNAEWTMLQDSLANAIQSAMIEAERFRQEMDDEDDLILLMAAS